MKNTQQLSDLIGSLTSANTDVEVTSIVNALKQAKATTANAVRTYGSVYSQNQMLQYDADGNIADVTADFEGREAISDSVLGQLKSDLRNQIANYQFQYSKLPEVTKEVTNKETVSVSATATVQGFDSQGSEVGQLTFSDGVISFNALGKLITIDVVNKTPVEIVDDVVVGSEGISVIALPTDGAATPTLQTPGTLVFGKVVGGSAQDGDAFSVDILLVSGCFIWVYYTYFREVPGNYLIDFSVNDDKYYDWTDMSSHRLAIPSTDGYQQGKAVVDLDLPHSVTETVEREISATASVSVRGLVDESEKIQQLLDAVP